MSFRPGWMSEKAIAIGHYFVASGVYVLFGTTFPTTGSQKYTDYLFRELEEEIESLGYSFFKPSEEEPFADTKEFIKEWLEDEELDGGDFSSSSNS